MADAHVNIEHDTMRMARRRHATSQRLDDHCALLIEFRLRDEAAVEQVLELPDALLTREAEAWRGGATRAEAGCGKAQGHRVSGP